MIAALWRLLAATVLIAVVDCALWWKLDMAMGEPRAPWRLRNRRRGPWLAMWCMGVFGGWARDQAIFQQQVPALTGAAVAAGVIVWWFRAIYQDIRED